MASGKLLDLAGVRRGNLFGRKGRETELGEEGPVSVLRKNKAKSRRYSGRVSREDLINAESALGRTLFGPIPTGHQREFFESEKNVWIWHEGCYGANGEWFAMTIRYEVRPAGVFKKVNQGSYKKIEGDELDNFREATRRYLELVKTKLYC